MFKYYLKLIIPAMIYVLKAKCKCIKFIYWCYNFKPINIYKSIITYYTSVIKILKKITTFTK